MKAQINQGVNCINWKLKIKYFIVIYCLNNKHWVSDVLVGAGLEILVTDLVYRFEPLKNWNPFNNKKVKTTAVPSYYKNSIGLYINVRF